MDLNLHQSDVKPIDWMKVLLSEVSVCCRIFSPAAEFFLLRPNFFGWTGPGVLAGSGSSGLSSLRNQLCSCAESEGMCVFLLSTSAPPLHCSTHRKEIKLKFILHIGYAVLLQYLACSFCKIDLKFEVISFTELVFCAWQRTRMPTDESRASNQRSSTFLARVFSESWIAYSFSVRVFLES